MDKLSRIVEALVFSAGRVVAPDEIRECVSAVSEEDGPSDEAIETAVDELNVALSAAGSVIEVHKWAGGYRMATASDVSAYVEQLFNEPPRRLTRSLMETLSIVAYRQPTTKPEIDSVRGVDSSYALRKLMELGFVAMVGRSEAVGKPLLFGTTARFLEDFGLPSLADLPKLREAEELFQSEQFANLRPEIDEPESNEEETAPVESEDEEEA